MTNTPKSTTVPGHCNCIGGSTHGIADTGWRGCDLCGGLVGVDPNTGEFVGKKSPTPTAGIGLPLTWEQALPLVRALRDIAHQSTDLTAAEVATDALHETFPGNDGLQMMFGRVQL